MSLLDLIWVVCLCYFQLPSAQARTESFSLADISGPAGLTFRQNNFATSEKYPFETLGGAVAILDYDNDGAPDLLLLNGFPSPDHLKTDPQSSNRLYRNTGKGSFADVTQGSGLDGTGKKGYPQGVAVGDYDNDGFVDVYVTSYGDNILYHNNGDGTFSDVTGRAGVAMSRHPFKASACWVDADNDGLPDLFVTNYFQWTLKDNRDDYCGEKKPGYRTYCTPDVFKPLPNVCYAASASTTSDGCGGNNFIKTRWRVPDAPKPTNQA